MAKKRKARKSATCSLKRIKGGRYLKVCPGKRPTFATKADMTRYGVRKATKKTRKSRKGRRR